MGEYKLYDINRLKPGDHVCCLYSTDEEHKNLITPFLKGGLDNNEKVLYIADDNTSDNIKGYLADDGVDADKYIEKGQLNIITFREFYTMDGIINPENMIKTLRDEVKKAVEEGYDALRATGEMSWALRDLPGSDRLMEYETKLNEFFPKNEILAICQYDTRLFSPEILLDVLGNHPIAMIGVDVYENLYYIPFTEFASINLSELTLNRWLENLQLRKEVEESLKSKEMLLKEIHHRVKNNLMIISSLLNLQSRYITDKTSLDIFKESQNRTRSMALIHERLYQTNNLKQIDFGDYIQRLSKELFQTYGTDVTDIDLKINVENILLDINTAIPLGLISNELITNSLKHAFPNGIGGEILVNFHSINGNYEFTVKDDGVGFPEDMNYKELDSLGLQIINNLTDQIDGKISLTQSQGTEFKITFQEHDC